MTGRGCMLACVHVNSFTCNSSPATVHQHCDLHDLVGLPGHSDYAAATGTGSYAQSSTWWICFTTQQGQVQTDCCLGIRIQSAAAWAAASLCSQAGAYLCTVNMANRGQLCSHVHFGRYCKWWYIGVFMYDSPAATTALSANILTSSISQHTHVIQRQWHFFLSFFGQRKQCCQ